jgi:hypothetical protein
MPEARLLTQIDATGGELGGLLFLEDDFLVTGAADGVLRTWSPSP